MEKKGQARKTTGSLLERGQQGLSVLGYGRKGAEVKEGGGGGGCIRSILFFTSEKGSRKSE